MIFPSSKLKFVLLASLLLLLASCSGDTGPTGPAGADGADGSDGADGNANVFASDWFRPLSYTLSTGFQDINLLDHDEAASEITQEILDTGVVLVYGKLLGYHSAIWPTGNVSMLPITLTYGQAPVEIDTWSAILSVGNLRIRFINSINTYTSLGTTHEFRYVVIPSNTLLKHTAASRSIESVITELADAGVDINNPQDVIDFYRVSASR